MIPQSAVERYLKIKAYAEKGSAGEQKNARKLMQKMEVEWPGIQHQAERPATESPFAAPSPRNGLGFWDAARDAMDIMAGRSSAPDLFMKYAQELEEQRRHEQAQPTPKLVKLTRDQARQLVAQLFAPYLSDTMFGAIKITATLGPTEARYWEFYSQDADNKALLCEMFGELMCRSMAEFMVEP